MLLYSLTVRLSLFFCTALGVVVSAPVPQTCMFFCTALGVVVSAPVPQTYMFFCTALGVVFLLSYNSPVHLSLFFCTVLGVVGFDPVLLSLFFCTAFLSRFLLLVCSLAQPYVLWFLVLCISLRISLFFCTAFLSWLLLLYSPVCLTLLFCTALGVQVFFGLHFSLTSSSTWSWVSELALLQNLWCPVNCIPWHFLCRACNALTEPSPYQEEGILCSLATL